MNIGLDFDGVIADTMELKQKLAKKFYNVDVPAHRFKEYMVVEDGLMTQPEYRKLMNAVCGDMKYGLDINEMDSAISSIKNFIKKGHSLKVITSREDSELEVAKEWCRRHDLDLEIISVGYGKNKVEAAQDLGAYIDDDLPKLAPLIGVVPKLFLFTQEHNKIKQVPKEIRRIYHWRELANGLAER